MDGRGLTKAVAFSQLPLRYQTRKTNFGKIDQWTTKANPKVRSGRFALGVGEFWEPPLSIGDLLDKSMGFRGKWMA